jgi:hypothetical protein
MVYGCDGPICLNKSAVSAEVHLIYLRLNGHVDVDTGSWVEIHRNRFDSYCIALSWTIWNMSYCSSSRPSDPRSRVRILRSKFQQ